jgi:hypothetical protein
MVSKSYPSLKKICEIRNRESSWFFGFQARLAGLAASCNLGPGFTRLAALGFA